MSRQTRPQSRHAAAGSQLRRILANPEPAGDVSKTQAQDVMPDYRAAPAGRQRRQCRAYLVALGVSLGLA
jgi:hypothetical protein